MERSHRGPGTDQHQTYRCISDAQIPTREGGVGSSELTVPLASARQGCKGREVILAHAVIHSPIEPIGTTFLHTLVTCVSVDVLAVATPESPISWRVGERDSASGVSKKNEEGGAVSPVPNACGAIDEHHYTISATQPNRAGVASVYQQQRTVPCVGAKPRRAASLANIAHPSFH